MLKKTERLSTRQFDEYFRVGRRLHGTYLQLIYSPAPVFHGAAVVGKKVAKKAVDRNKQRRRIYNALYALKGQQDLVGVYILIAKPPTANVGYKTLKQEIEYLVGQTRKKS